MRASLGAVVVAVLSVSAPALGDGREFGFSIGYAHLFWDGAHTDALEEQGGIRVDARLSWAATRAAEDTRRPELWLGVGVALGGFISDRGGDVFVDDGVVFVEPDDWDQLSVIEPELMVSLRTPLDDHWYVEPGLAATGTIGHYVRGEEFFGIVDEDIDRWRLGGGGRMFVRVAYRNGRSAWGLEGSYSYGWLDFGDDIGGDIQRGHLTFFYARSF
jgi:hypothetical protein